MISHQLKGYSRYPILSHKPIIKKNIYIYTRFPGKRCGCNPEVRFDLLTTRAAFGALGCSAAILLSVWPFSSTDGFCSPLISLKLPPNQKIKKPASLQPSRHPGEVVGSWLGPSLVYEGFLKWVSPIAGWITMKNPKIKWMIWGYPHFRKLPYLYNVSTWYYAVSMSTVWQGQAEGSQGWASSPP